MNPMDSKNQMKNTKNKNVILLCNLMILWDLTRGCAVLGFGNDMIVHFFLPVFHSVLLRSASRKELLLFHFCFVRSVFLPILCFCGHSSPTLLCSSSWCCWQGDDHSYCKWSRGSGAVSTPCPGDGLQVGWRSGPRTASEFSTLACSWPELRWLTSPICTCGKRHFCLAPGVLVHLIKVTGYVCTGKQARQRLHRAMHCMRISVPLSALQCVWVHIKFIPVSTSWAALEHALKVLLQASQMDRRWIQPGVLSL